MNLLFADCCISQRGGASRTRTLANAYLAAFREKYPEARLVFITTDNAQTLVDRLTGRGTETEEVIRKRLTRAVEEANGVENYDYIVINGVLEESIGHLHEVIQSESGFEPTKEDYAIIQNIQSDLKSRLSI